MSASKNPPELYKTILQLINDPQGRIWKEDQLDVFIDEAGNLLPRLTASLIGMSRGVFDVSERLAAWPGVPRRQNSLTDSEVKGLATVFRDIFTVPDIADETRLRMAESQILAIEKWNLPSESLNRIDALIKET